MSMAPRSLPVVAFILGALGGCFLTPNEPPSFRFECEVDDDCRVLTCLGDPMSIRDARAAGLAEGCDGEVAKADPSKGIGYTQQCIAGLCQFPCDVSTYLLDCPFGKGTNAFCFNGGCATVCGGDSKRFPDADATCPAPQTCAKLDEDIDFALLAAFLPQQTPQGVVNLNALPDGAGLCGQRCDDPDAPPCPGGQYCTGALCLPDCDHPDATPCPDDQTCFAYGDFSACLSKCDPAAPNACGQGQVCVIGVGVCAPSCVGPDAIECSEGFTCDASLQVCIPEGGSLTEGEPGTTSDTAGTSG